MFFNFKSITLSVLLTVGLASLATACEPTGGGCNAEIHPNACCSRICEAEAGSDPTIGVSRYSSHTGHYVNQLAYFPYRHAFNLPYGAARFMEVVSMGLGGANGVVSRLV